jgi:nitronate monooxygenase
MSRAPLAPYPVQNSLTREIRQAAAKAGNADFLSLWAGQGAHLAREMPAGELVAQIMREKDKVVSQL